jgi:hypothetical protein
MTVFAALPFPIDICLETMSIEKGQKQLCHFRHRRKRSEDWSEPAPKVWTSMAPGSGSIESIRPMSLPVCNSTFRSPWVRGTEAKVCLGTCCKVMQSQGFMLPSRLTARHWKKTERCSCSNLRDQLPIRLAMRTLILTVPRCDLVLGPKPAAYGLASSGCHTRTRSSWPTIGHISNLKFAIFLGKVVAKATRAMLDFVFPLYIFETSKLNVGTWNSSNK